MNVLITGCTGFVGGKLIDTLINSSTFSDSVTLYGLVRREPSKSLNHIKTVTMDQLSDLQIDTLINLAGEPIAAKRWSPSRKAALRSSRTTVTETLYKSLKHPPKTVISMSAVGYYGNHESTQFKEATPSNGGFTYQLCDEWEKAALAFESKGSRVCIFRLGVVLGNGGALKQMLIPYTLGLGGKIGAGMQGFPWIHIDDVCNAVLKAIESEQYTGAINLVAPEQVTQHQFATNFARSLNRPSVLPTPSILLQMLLGEMSELLTKGQFVVPEKLTQLGFQYQYPRIEAALKACAEELSVFTSTQSKGC
ncbi:TIGR01777 family oxidoreductase [Marinomonas balearica]|uniref:TIGR01777 family protein n=1 Tax=Marinomonas balearica TaxID=491947 RepID=A0A4R6M5Y2_9GAMM|nr:TIGR01777 family oxidoreductase [Marinomonas balearica]TDO96771.1 hypothetical protein DFP79_2539 [Marinomonas balearica]